MKVNCLSCGHNIDLDEAYSDGYEGEIKCFGCEARLEIRTEQNALRSVRMAPGPSTNEEHNGGARIFEGAGAEPGPSDATRRTAQTKAPGKRGPAGPPAANSRPL